MFVFWYFNIYKSIFWTFNKFNKSECCDFDFVSIILKRLTKNETDNKIYFLS